MSTETVFTQALALVSVLSLTEWLILLLLLLVIHSYLSRSPWKRLPPGPPSFPVIGSLPYLRGDLSTALETLRVKYGDVFTIYLGPVRAIVLNGYDVIKEAIIRQTGDFDARSKLWEEFTHRNGIVTASGEQWKETRRFLLRALRDFGLGGRKMEIRIQEESQHMIDELQDVCGKPYNIDPLLKKVVSNIISVLLFGRRWEYDDVMYSEHIRISDEVMALISVDNPVWTITNLKYIPGDPFSYDKTLRMWDELGKTYKRWIKDHEERIQTGEEPEDIIGLYLTSMNKKKQANENTTFTVGALEEVIKEMYLGGTDTTSGTLLWSFVFLMRNPHVQEKVQAEIDAVIGRARIPRMQDRSKMPYTEAVICEVQRCCDMFPLSVHHAADGDREFRGYTIPNDTMVLMNLHSVHWDTELWPNPHVFDPERFLVDGVLQRKEELMPFSIGKRQCIGKGLAQMEVFIFLTHLLQTFTISIPPDHPPPSTAGKLGLSNQVLPFKMTIHSRM